MSRRRSFPAEGPRSNKSRSANAPGKKDSGRRPRSTESAGQERRRRHHDDAAHPPERTKSGGPDSGKLERLQKVLAHAGLGSRRACEELILQGRVSVDGTVVRELGTRVDPARARIAVDGEPIKLESMVYYAVNKPKGYVSTNVDPAGRPRVVDLLPEIPQRVYTVGRLDEDSTGLIILTNDGELANRLTHPRYGVEKLYRALVAGLPGREMLTKLTEGVWLSDGKVRAKRARFAGRQGQATVLELVLAEGKKREIRRMLSKLGHKVMSLNRIAVGPVSLKGLALGQCRPLSRHEVDLLQKVASGTAVSLPEFFDAEHSARPARGAHRPNKPSERQRPHAGDAGPPRGRPDRSHHERPGPRPGSKPGRERRHQRPPSRHEHGPSPAAPPGHRPGSSARPNHKMQPGRHARMNREAGSAPLPRRPQASRRRIIGMPAMPAPETGPASDGGKGRTRPPLRKRRPPRIAPRKRSVLSPGKEPPDDET
jgi:23S rRNA pseudouridine2605 synthase